MRIAGEREILIIFLSKLIQVFDTYMSRNSKSLVNRSKDKTQNLLNGTSVKYSYNVELLLSRPASPDVSKFNLIHTKQLIIYTYSKRVRVKEHSDGPRKRYQRDYSFNKVIKFHTLYEKPLYRIPACITKKVSMKSI